MSDGGQAALLARARTREQIKPSPSSSAADSALSPPSDRVGRIADPAALASKDTAVDTWLRAPLCVGSAPS